MAYRDGPLQDLRVPLAWAGAAAAIVAIIVALALLFTDRREDATPGAYGSARAEFDQVVAPVTGVVAAPLRWAGAAVDYVEGYFFAVSENRRLRRRVAELERWRDAAIALKNINTRYEALLKLRTEPPIPMATARVVSDARGPFSNARLADAGSDSGIKVGNPAISERGVVGRVVGVSRTASRVLLLTDVDSRTPVLVDRTNARAILTGDGGPAPRLEYLRGRDGVKEGDRILTSGDGGLYPRGLPVGVAVRDVRGGWRVRLYTDEANIDYIRVLEFDDFSQSVDQTALSTAPVPPITAKEKAEIEAALSGKPIAPPPASSTTAAKPAGASTASPAASIPAHAGAGKPAAGSDPAGAGTPGSGRTAPTTATASAAAEPQAGPREAGTKPARPGAAKIRDSAAGADKPGPAKTSRTPRAVSPDASPGDRTARPARPRVPAGTDPAGGPASAPSQRTPAPGPDSLQGLL